MRCWDIMLAAVVMMPGAYGETVRLKATADIGVSSEIYGGKDERELSWGLSERFKLKSVQEMAVIRFDAIPAKGREVKSARLFLHRASSDMLRYIRVSTVNGDWQEGQQKKDYGPPDGACYNYADWNTKRPWAWPGSCLADVIMTSGNSIAAWVERKELPDGWVSVELTPELIYALVAGDTDGLAIMDGGNHAYHNNFIHSIQSGQFAPYIEVELGKQFAAMPETPAVKAEADGERAHMNSGSIRVEISGAKDVFCWQVTLNGKPVEHWRVKHPSANGRTRFYLEDLTPGRTYRLEVRAVAPWGAVSTATALDATASTALPQGPTLNLTQPPMKDGASPANRRMTVWALPGLVKISPEKPEPLFADIGGGTDPRAVNAVWDGKTVRLSGARGEYVSYQLCIERNATEVLTGVKVTPGNLVAGNGTSIGADDIELFKDWYAKNQDHKWQPAYLVPMKHGTAFQIPDPDRKTESQQNQTVYVDVFIPYDAPPEVYKGTVTVAADGAESLTLPVELTVWNLSMPVQLSFWPQLNAYIMPKNVHSYYKLAHQNRSIFYYRSWRPKVEGKGKDIRVIWDDYDAKVGPVLDGSLFKEDRRAGQPVEAFALPFADGWPTPLTKETYNYQGHWPGKGEHVAFITEHYMKAPYIGDALSQDYKDAFHAVQRQFIEHAGERAWDRTQFHCVYVGKNTHRTNYGSNMWWTTDEPYHWDDWLALQFFCRLWKQGMGDTDPRRWAARADISRPQWQGRVLDGLVDTVYFGTGCFLPPSDNKRCMILGQETDIRIQAYGSANRDNESNTATLAWMLDVWLNGGNGVLPWQSIGNDKSLDENDQSTEGNALLVPGDRFGLDTVADMRLKAMRDGEQLIEYLVLVAVKYHLNREQMKAMVGNALQTSMSTRKGAGADDAGAVRFDSLKAWQIAGLRQALASLATE